LCSFQIYHDISITKWGQKMWWGCLNLVTNEPN
jgi:hypothetical protein